jgi:pyruvate,water dikinase
MRWTVIDHEPSRTFPIYCRGNVGEVYPNVMTPLTGSLVYRAAQRGQESVVLGLGFLSRSHIDDSNGAITGVFGGYLYGNVSMTRVGAARAPGMTVADVDEQMFGLSDAPPYVPRPDDRSLRCTMRLARKTGRALLLPDRGIVERDRRGAAAWIAGLPSIHGASDEQLIEIARRLPPKFEEMMARLLLVSAFAGISRATLERLTSGSTDPSLVNRLTAGLGTIESAEPAFALWTMGRMVAGSATLTDSFDQGVEGLAERLRSQPDAAAFRAAFDRFLAAFGTRGPDEWELASPTWGTDPDIALAAIDRLRHSPVDRDPERARDRLSAERDRATVEATRTVRAAARPLFRRALDAATLYAATREATKATFVRCLDPARRALKELASRHDVERAELFLLTIEELPSFLRTPDAFADTIAERRRIRDDLQSRFPPFWFEGEIPPPDTWPLRAEQRCIDDQPRTLEGLGVCPGTATGPARVVTNPAEPGALRPGDILVAPITDPAWTPLFLAVAGVIVDVGAQLSHAAIIARELGIPAVVSATGASNTIADGSIVTVDGTRGTVTIHAPA